MDAAITCFDLKPCGASQPAVHVVVGNLHIVCDSNVKPPTLATRQRILKKLRDELQKYAAPQRHMSVVRLIVGDDNLSTEEAVQALQQEKDVEVLLAVLGAPPSLTPSGHARPPETFT